jgi:hypothetical protein
VELIMLNAGKSVVKLAAWKKQTCLYCGCLFRYRLKREGRGSGATGPDADREATRRAARRIGKESDPHPCPSCGYVQPDMIGNRRAGWRDRVLLFNAAAVLVSLPLLFFFTLPVLTLLVALACGAAVVAHGVLFVWNPNRNRKANRGAAEAAENEGVLKQVSDPDPDAALDELPRTGLTLRHGLAFGLCVAGFLLLISPEVLRAKRPWPVNSHLSPSMIAPGEELHLGLGGSFRSLEGMWQATGSVAVVNPPAEVPNCPRTLSFTSGGKPWGDRIESASRITWNEQSVTPWLDVQLPDQPELVGKTLRLDIQMNVAYPIGWGTSTFKDEQKSYNLQTSVAFAAPGARQTYRAVWITTTALGLLLCLGGGLALRWLDVALRSWARDAEVTPAGRRGD